MWHKFYGRYSSKTFYKTFYMRFYIKLYSLSPWYNLVLTMFWFKSPIGFYAAILKISVILFLKKLRNGFFYHTVYLVRHWHKLLLYRHWCKSPNNWHYYSVFCRIYTICAIVIYLELMLNLKLNLMSLESSW